MVSHYMRGVPRHTIRPEIRANKTAIQVRMKKKLSWNSSLSIHESGRRFHPADAHLCKLKQQLDGVKNSAVVKHQKNQNFFRTPISKEIS
jgi:hypothetical protein